MEALCLVGMPLYELRHPISQHSRRIEISYFRPLLTSPKTADIDEQTINQSVLLSVLFFLLETLCVSITDTRLLLIDN